jgi:hypothetical protein
MLVRIDVAGAGGRDAVSSGANNNSYFRQHPVIFGVYLAVCVADQFRSAPATTRQAGGKKMMEQEAKPPVSDNLVRLTRPARPVDIQLALANIVATTRREWMSPLPVASSPDGAMLKRARFAQSLIRLAPGARRRATRRARIGGQEWIERLALFVELDQTPEGTS